MLLMMLRTVFVYVFILIIMRFMGKRQMGEMQASELVTTLIISNLASISIEEQNVPLLASLIPVVMIACLEIILSALTVKSKKIEHIVEGEPKVIIQNGKILQKNLLLMRFTVEEILSALREKSIFDPTKVTVGIIESNGNLTAYANEESEESVPPVTVIVDGSLSESKLHECEKDKEWLQQLLRSENKKIKNILLMLVYKDGRIHITEYEEKKA